MAARPGKKRDAAGAELLMPAGGLEAEFTLMVDDRPARPEDVFGDPRGFLRLPLMHRTGRSFHLPNGAAVYFDTGVIEIATPAMELERGCFLRLSRSLHDALHVVREQLDAWERRSGHRARLQGFSAHYNVSTGTAPARRANSDAWMLAHILPAPVMLLATNRLSTGVGVRPRRGRIEITADFSPDAMRIAATGAVIAGIVSGTRTWTGGLHAVRARRIPMLAGFTPMRHTSRRGWLARFDCFPLNPFACHVDSAVWQTTHGRMTLRGLARRVTDAFDAEIRGIADPASYLLARRILTGRTSSWLDEEQRPAAYDDAGRRAVEERTLGRAGHSRYERVVRNAVSGRPLKLDADWWVPVRVRGWSRIVLRRERDGAEVTQSIDALVGYLEGW